MTPSARSEDSVRTSVFLPAYVLDQLASFGGTQSENIRLALERYLYIRSSALSWTDHIVETHGELLEAVLEDYDETDYKTIARVLPELVLNFGTESQSADMLSRGVSSAVEALKDL